MGVKQVIRDVDANKDVKELVENGYFAEEISLYGCAYVLNQRICFRIHDNESAIRNFVRREEEAGTIFPTLVDTYYSRKKIPSGMREMKKEEARADLLARMKVEYPSAFFSAFMPLAEYPANDSAAVVLKQWMQGLFCCFDSLQLQLFEGAVKICRQAKLLDIKSYNAMRQWCEDRWIQIQRQSQVYGAYNCHFYGFAYQEQAEWHVFCDANALVVWRHYEKTLCEGNFVTPIVQSRFEMDSLRNRERAKLEERFLRQIDEVMSDAYFSMMKYLYELPSAIPQQLLDHQREKIDKIDSLRAKETFSYWLTKWHCFSL